MGDFEHYTQRSVSQIHFSGVFSRLRLFLTKILSAKEIFGQFSFGTYKRAAQREHTHTHRERRQQQKGRQKNKHSVCCRSSRCDVAFGTLRIGIFFAFVVLFNLFILSSSPSSSFSFFSLDDEIAFACLPPFRHITECWPLQNLCLCATIEERANQTLF